MTQPDTRILIANRGEIACRIAQTCRRMGVPTVAVYSEPDARAHHVAQADTAICIGPAAAAESYLNADAILDAAHRSGATAIHPGYGFLSESAEFARKVIAAGVVWIGPSPEVIDAMGDKERAREIARAAGVPVLPGSSRYGPDALQGLMDEAETIGFPLLVKAAAGGGGIGMRRVDDSADLPEVVSATQSMAAKAFGDASVYMERFIPSARHVEVQVFGFGDGAGIHLFDRDCSVQRRFQKIIEEAPAPAIPDALRASLHDAAVSLVRHQRYAGAGTVEFVYDNDRDTAYFLEMNTRIQVEHPVTEAVTGVDLVEWQIRQAMGALPSVPQSEIGLSGHAVECRLYAERPDRNFLPAPGKIERLDWPVRTEGLRVDAGFGSGDEITPFYDPLVGKLIAHGEDRAAALSRMMAALDDLVVEGLRTNRAFLAEVVADEAFANGQLSTGFVDGFMARKRDVGKSRAAG